MEAHLFRLIVQIRTVTIYIIFLDILNTKTIIFLRKHTPVILEHDPLFHP